MGVGKGGRGGGALPLSGLVFQTKTTDPKSVLLQPSLTVLFTLMFQIMPIVIPFNCLIMIANRHHFSVILIHVHVLVHLVLEL